MSIDKRVIKTKYAIKKAFMELSLVNDLSKISVSDLSSRAQINRSTFYLHYESVADIAKDIDADCARSISECMQTINADDIYGSTYSSLIRLTDKLDRDEQLKQYIINSTNSQRIAQKLKDLFAEKAIGVLGNRKPEEDKDKYSYLIYFVSGGVIDCYLKWARADDGTSLETIVAQLSKIIKLINDVI